MCLAAPPGLSVKLGPVSTEDNRSPAHTLRRTFPWKGHTGQNRCGARVSIDPGGHLSQIHFLTVGEPLAMRLLPRSSIARYPSHVPITAGGLRADPPYIFPRGRGPANGGHSDWTRCKNVQPIPTGCTNASDSGPPIKISTEKLRGAAGFGACIRSLEPANPLAACETGCVFQSRLYPRRIRAFSKCTTNCWNVLPSAKYADRASAASS